MVELTRSSRARAWNPGIACLALVCCCCCATYENRLVNIRQAFHSGDLAQASREIDEALKHPKHDADVLKLERAIVELASGQAKPAEQTLREVRDRFDYLEQKSIAES